MNFPESQPGGSGQGATSPSPGADSPEGLAASHRWCRSSTRHHAKSFFFASFPLPPQKRRAAYAVYAFCRHADDLVDEAGPGADLHGVIDDLGRAFDEITTGGRRDLPFAPAFAETVARYQLEKQPFQDLVKGVAMDLGPVRIANWPELREYCYHVASVVGLIMCPILGLRDPAGREQAIDLGIAMQLTNIIRDVAEDLDRDRIYLPADELAAAGLSEADLRAGRADERWRKFLNGQIKRAREYYRSGEQGIPLLEDDGSRLTVRLMSAIYGDILRAVECLGGDVFRTRARTSLPRKLFLAWKVASFHIRRPHVR